MAASALSKIPRSLLEAQSEGRLIIFTGSGIASDAELELPSYADLLVFCADSRDIPKGENEAYDHYLGRLQRQYSIDVRSKVIKIFKDADEKVQKKIANGNAKFDYHATILRLFPSAQDTKIITTNYDKSFEYAATLIYPKKVEVTVSAGPSPSEGLEDNIAADVTVLKAYQFPNFPVDSHFNGLVYLHSRYDGGRDGFVITDKDYSLRYVVKSDVADFLRKVFEDSEYKLLFLGCGFNDPILHYYMLGAHTGNCFVMHGSPKESPKWDEFNVTQILSNDWDEHMILIKEWALYSDASFRGGGL